jgi:hypothetical protein
MKKPKRTREYLAGYKAGMEAAISKVKYWKECHESRLAGSTNNTHIQCEIKDCTELARSLEKDLEWKLR